MPTTRTTAPGHGTGERTRPSRPDVAPLWITQNGRVACLNHGGAQLAARARPGASTVTTDLDHWVGVDATVLAEAGASVEGFVCESCGASVDSAQA